MMDMHSMIETLQKQNRTLNAEKSNSLKMAHPNGHVRARAEEGTSPQEYSRTVAAKDQSAVDVQGFKPNLSNSSSNQRTSSPVCHERFTMCCLLSLSV
jgi:hypothetical protein